MERLKSREKEVLRAIIHLSKEKGYYPSIREIGAEGGLSSTLTLCYYLENLKCKGYIKKMSKSLRAIQIKLMNCPECGQELIPESGCAYCPYCGWSKCS